MGVERAVTRWYLQRQAIQIEIADLEIKLAKKQAGGQKPESQEQTDDERQLVNAQARLRTLGPCPKAMMG